MNVLEKILEEIEEEIRDSIPFSDQRADGLRKARDIIRKHMSELSRENNQENTRLPRDNGGWIPVEARLPEIREIVKVTVHSSEWIGDYDSDWVPEEDKIHHPEEYHVHDGYLNENGAWVFYDDEYSENICEKKFGTNKGRIYDVVTAGSHFQSHTDRRKEQKNENQKRNTHRKPGTLQQHGGTSAGSTCV